MVGCLNLILQNYIICLDQIISRTRKRTNIAKILSCTKRKRERIRERYIYREREREREIERDGVNFQQCTYFKQAQHKW